MSAYGVLVNLIELAHWASGKKVTAAGRSEDAASDCESGEAGAFRRSVTDLCSAARVQTQISRFTQALGRIGAGAVNLWRSGENASEAIPSEEVEHEVELLLEVTGANLSGGPTGWTFRESGGGLEFSAILEDESFLADVKNRRIVFENGLRIQAAVRVAERRITAVREIIPPSGG